MKFEATSTKKGPLTRVGVKMVLPEVDTSTKGKIRKKINEDVGDVYSLLADANEMISLLMSTVSVLYEAQSDETIAKMPADKKAFIEYAVGKFAATTTSADVKFAVDPTGTVDKLMDGQAAIGIIVSDIERVRHD